MTIFRKCPFCYDNSFKIERIGTTQNLYWLICLSPQTEARRYVELRPNGRFRPVSVSYPKPRTPIKSVEKAQFDKLQIPYWRMMGQKAKEKDEQYEKYLKWRNMTYGDAVLERSLKGEYQNAMPQMEQHLNETR